MLPIEASESELSNRRNSSAESNCLQDELLLKIWVIQCRSKIHKEERKKCNGLPHYLLIRVLTEGWNFDA